MATPGLAKISETSWSVIEIFLNLITLLHSRCAKPLATGQLQLLTLTEFPLKPLTVIAGVF
jgi:hypothetical protein